MSKNKNQGKGLVTAAMLEDPFECPFKNDRERIKYMKENYEHLPLVEQFAVFYGEKLSKDLSKNKKINNPVNVKLGECYKGNVVELNKTEIKFEVPGCKEEIICKEDFSDCIDNVRNYLLNHNNELLFYVRERRDNRWYVSVFDAYYKAWQKQIEKAIDKRMSINVHIDSLVKGGYMCHTNIWTISELTGKTYTSAVFIPGSNIVLNIETDFDKWLGQDVQAVPQKFTKFRSFGRPVENSLMASRKLVLKILGMKNMYEIYTRAKLAQVPGVKYTPEVFQGKVTGIINSNKKTGVFLEIEDKYITGLMPVDSTRLLNYKPGDYVNVIIKEFECLEGQEPFYIDKSSVIRKCNVRPVFEQA